MTKSIRPHVPNFVGLHAARRLIGRVVSPVRKPAGSAPGTLVHTGPRKVESVRIQRLRYDPDDLAETSAERIEDVLPPPGVGAVHWINVDGLHDPSVLEYIGAHYDFHRLVLEDVLSTHQRPKTEDHGTYFFVVMKMLSYDEQAHAVHAEQVSLIVTEGLLLSFQERPGDVFEPVRQRLRTGKGRIRAGAADYLAYALIDAIVDSYFSVLERVGDRIEELEEQAIRDVSSDTMQAIHALRREVLILRRAVWPLRDALGPMYRGDVEQITPETRVFVRDVHDHAVQVIDTVESLREVLSATMDLHLSSVSTRMNEVMKVLTMIATIFIPLSFFAGVYGMNFEHMPELAIPWAYPALLAFMLASALGMLGYFKRKGWF
ncbi:MAG: magnesium/cobalt transporter CorA [Gemmatimonadota bacterium]|nr:magnesium/cobalt transporter CorA [Gemmatimonadota bacterium]